MMIIHRKLLIDMCDKFLNDDIDKNAISLFASNLIFSDDIDWDEHDKILSNTIFEWANEDINYPITNLNISLWKKRLEHNIDELDAYNFWNYHIEKQKEICALYNSKWQPINKKLQIDISGKLKINPIRGVREEAKKGTTGWVISSGNSKESDFSTPILAEELLQLNPSIIKFLGLEAGFRFEVNRESQVKVWKE